MRRLLGTIMLLPLATPVAYAGDVAPPDARAMALTCETCHWIETSPPSEEKGIPSLHGRNATALLRKLREYRNGVGDPTIMNRIARGFTDEQLVRIAEYIAGAGGAGSTP